MKKITELMPGTHFYIGHQRTKIFVLVGVVPKKEGSAKMVSKCIEVGKAKFTWFTKDYTVRPLTHPLKTAN
jgi:hypothetical protein